MIRIRFFGPGELNQNGFPLHRNEKKQAGDNSAETLRTQQNRRHGGWSTSYLWTLALVTMGEPANYREVQQPRASNFRCVHVSACVRDRRRDEVLTLRGEENLTKKLLVDT